MVWRVITDQLHEENLNSINARAITEPFEFSGSSESVITRPCHVTVITLLMIAGEIIERNHKP